MSGEVVVSKPNEFALDTGLHANPQIVFVQWDTKQQGIIARQPVWVLGRVQEPTWMGDARLEGYVVQANNWVYWSKGKEHLYNRWAAGELLFYDEPAPADGPEVEP